MTLLGYLKVCRPPLTLLGFIAPLSLYLWSHKVLDTQGFLVIISIFTGNLGYTLLNEVMDAETDAVNKKWKPIPSGQADLEKVLIASMFLVGFSLASLIVLFLFFSWFYMIGVFGLMFSHVYDVLRKDLLGNICMSGAYGIAALISLYPNYLEFSLAFFLFTFAFNLAVQYQDLEAEKTVGVVTAPQQLGKTGTYLLGFNLSGLSIVIFIKLFMRTSYMPLIFFVMASVLCLASVIGVLYVDPESKVQELLNRYLARMSILVGFISMIMLEVMG